MFPFTVLKLYTLNSYDFLQKNKSVTKMSLIEK